MQPWLKTKRGLIWNNTLATLGWIILGVAAPAAATAADRTTTKTELHLTEDFYRALRSEGAKTYATGSSDEHLRQIAVSTRFMVETNLQLIEQQNRIIQLLEELKALQAKP
jgi:hypothetical protein